MILLGLFGTLIQPTHPPQFFLLESCAICLVFHFSGGHQEYFAASALFMASTGLFLLCFDSSNLPTELSGNDYYSRVGTYLDLVTQMAALADIKPKIMLVATKLENPEKCQESLDKILALSKAHLASISSDSFLVEDILRTSSKIASKEVFGEMYGKIFTLCTADELRSKPKEAIPTFWYRLLAALKELSQTTVDEVIKKLQQIKAEQTGPPTIPKEELESLEKLREVMKYLTEVNDSKSKLSTRPDIPSGEPMGAKRKTEPEPNKEQRREQSREQSIEPSREPSKEPSEVQQEANTRRQTGPTALGAVEAMEAWEPSASAAVDLPHQDLQDNSEAHELENAKKEAREEGITVLGFLRGLGEVLFYPDNPALSEVVITRPMDFVRSLRTVISHKTKDNFENFQYQKSALLHKGLLSFEDFRTIYANGPDQTFSEEEVWHNLIELNLACPMDENPENRHILVPCLISDKMEEMMKTREKELEVDESCISIQYGFRKNNKTMGMFNKFLETITRSLLLGEKGGEILMSYSQKVEQKKLGNVAAVNGVLKWHTKGIQKPEDFEFLLAEYETTFPSPDPEEDTSSSQYYGRHRGIKFMLRRSEGPVNVATFDILRKLDTEFSLDLQSMAMAMDRWQFCRLCLREGKHGYFPLKEGIRIKSAHGRCSRLKHSVDKCLVELMEKCHEPEPFQLKSLMEMKKESLGLEAFDKSDIKNKMLRGDLDRGTQIWIYHDADTNPWNPVARTNPYAHVVVYVGPRNKEGKTVHEVVHVAKDSWQGLVVAGISKVDVMSVIKPNDMVFLGHRIKECQFSGNVGAKIAERAIACAEKPKILFAYDHRCEHKLVSSSTKLVKLFNS